MTCLAVVVGINTVVIDWCVRRAGIKILTFSGAFNYLPRPSPPHTHLRSVSYWQASANVGKEAKVQPRSFLGRRDTSTQEYLLIFKIRLTSYVINIKRNNIFKLGRHWGDQKPDGGSDRHPRSAYSYFRQPFSPSLMLCTLHKSLIFPCMEYASHVWRVSLTHLN